MNRNYCAFFSAMLVLALIAWVCAISPTAHKVVAITTATFLAMGGATLVVVGFFSKYNDGGEE